MSDIIIQLQQFAKEFRESLVAASSGAVRDASDRALDRLIEWSGSQLQELAVRGPEGVDAAFGVIRPGNNLSIWRMYPRQPDAGKVTLLAKAEHHLTADERERIVKGLEDLRPVLTIGPNQRLEIGLPRIAGESQWASYVPLLELAVEVARRSQDSAAHQT